MDEKEIIDGALNKLYDRVGRLEKLAERLYHEVELYNTYIPRITDVLIRYFPTMDNYRKEINIMMMIHKGFLENIENELQDHFEFHSHSDKKTNKYTIK